MARILDKSPKLVVARSNKASSIEKDYLEATKSATFDTYDAISRDTNEGDYDGLIDSSKHATPLGKGTVEIEYAVLLDLLKHHLDLEQGLASLAAATGGTATEYRRRAQSITDIETVAGVYKKFLVGAIGWNPLDTAPSALAISAAEKVLRVPELLEMILCELEPKAILAASQVNRAFAGAATWSAKVQALLSLQPNWDSLWQTNFGLSAPFALDVDVEEGDPLYFASRFNIDGDMLGTRMTAKFLANSRMTIGSRCRSMLICQPPICMMDVLPSCCAFDNMCARKELQTVCNDHGLTVGDLYDAVLRTQREHRLCPGAWMCQHNPKDGYVNAEVRFEGNLRLQERDPIHSSRFRDRADDRRSAFARHSRRSRTSRERLKARDLSPRTIARRFPAPLRTYIHSKKNGTLDSLLCRALANRYSQHQPMGHAFLHTPSSSQETDTTTCAANHGKSWMQYITADHII